MKKTVITLALLLIVGLIAWAAYPEYADAARRGRGQVRIRKTGCQGQQVQQISGRTANCGGQGGGQGSVQGYGFNRGQGMGRGMGQGCGRGVSREQAYGMQRGRGRGMMRGCAGSAAQGGSTQAARNCDSVRKAGTWDSGNTENPCSAQMRPGRGRGLGRQAGLMPVRGRGRQIALNAGRRGRQQIDEAVAEGCQEQTCGSATSVAAGAGCGEANGSAPGCGGVGEAATGCSDSKQPVVAAPAQPATPAPAHQPGMGRGMGMGMGMGMAPGRGLGLGRGMGMGLGEGGCGGEAELSKAAPPTTASIQK